MRRLRIRRGLDVPLGGAPAQVIERGPAVRSVAVLGADHRGLRPSLAVREGERVRLGSVLVRDRRIPELVLTSPGAGVVTAIHRGARRALESVVVRLEGGDEERWPAVPRDELGRLDAEHVRERLLDSGLWTALRMRPFGSVARPGDQPRALFVTATDTNPLAPDPAVVLASVRDDFADGLAVLERLVEAPIFLCVPVGARLPAGDPRRIETVEVSGPHPAGLVGTHIHLLAPASRRRVVWHVGYQDVVAIGRLFTAGRISTERVISLGGPDVRLPRLVRTRLGASVTDLVAGELDEGPSRLVSGSALSGRTAAGAEAFLGRHHLQITVLPEDTRPVFLGGLTPRHGWSTFRALWPARHRALTTSLHGRPQPLIPFDVFERVLPLDLLPVPLFRALLVGDLETAEMLGCLELDEEDLALCTAVCPSKIEYGALLRSTLTEIART